MLLDSAVSEKKHQYHDRKGLAIECQNPERAYPLCVSVHAPLFHRVLSNLIDNAVEAIEGSGQVRINVDERDGQIRLLVCDSGRGIPAEVLPSLMKKGKTFGKPSGSGLGLHAAKQTLEAWNGTLQIESAVGEGTTVTVMLPAVQPPAWFVPEIRIPKGATVAVVDDDESIHAVWSSRLQPYRESESLQLLHYRDLPGFRQFCERRALTGPLVVLMDYEFQDSDRGGLDCLKCLGITGPSILVTSRADEMEIRERCLASGVSLLPKSASPFVGLCIG